MSPVRFGVGVSIAASFLSVTALAQSPNATPLPSLQPSASNAIVLPNSGVPLISAQDSLAKPCEEQCPGEPDWKKIPKTRAFPKPGNWPVLDTGPGYYALFDQICGDRSEKPPKYPYPRFGLVQPSFFDLDNFSYLDDPKNTECDAFDFLKRIRPNDDWLFVTGGDLRSRYENHYNARLREANNDYLLSRVRAYGDLWYLDKLRLYGEFIGAWSSGQELAPLPIDRNHADLLNLFADVKVAEKTYGRVGRQELLLGSQRLASPLDWANTRRTFQGARLMKQTEDWDLDVFWVQPVVPNAHDFDSVDNNHNFAGIWYTNRPCKGQAVDAYYLMLDNTNRTSQLGLSRGQFTRHTLGSRYHGNVENWLFDCEGAVQLGEQNGNSVFAAMATIGGGYNFKDAPLNPTLWLYYDFASGSDARDGTRHTFHQLFPFGHYYLGWIDQVGRSNIHDLNMHLYLYPAKWLTTWIQFHNFWLANSSDALYNAAGNAIRRDSTGQSGKFVGHEVDLVFNFHLSKHADLLTGYSYLFGGDFLKNTANSTNASNAGFFFIQTSIRW